MSARRIIFSLFAIFLPKTIKIGGNLTKFWQKQFCTVFLRHCVDVLPLLIPNSVKALQVDKWLISIELILCWHSHYMILLQLEDDVVTKPGYLTIMKDFVLSQKMNDWILLEFSHLGFIGDYMLNHDDFLEVLFNWLLWVKYLQICFYHIVKPSLVSKSWQFTQRIIDRLLVLFNNCLRKIVNIH